MVIPFPDTVHARGNSGATVWTGQLSLDAAGQQRLLHLGLFSTGLAHQLRHTLAAQIGLSEVLLESLPTAGDFEARRQAMRLREEGLRGLRLLRLWLDYLVRPGPVQLTPLYIDEVVDDAAALWRLQRFSPAARLETAPAPSGLRILGVAPALEQVLLNLFCNASRAMAEAKTGSVIRVEARRRDRLAILQVEDDGPGIAPERQKTLFEPLAEASPGASASAESDSHPGLGLFLCRWLMRQMNGEIRLVESQPGHTCFEIRAPLLDVASTRVVRPPRTRLHAAPPPERFSFRRKPMKVLVIEDEPAIVEFLRAAFRRHGDHVHCVRSLAQARRLLLRSHWDLILLDWTLGAECASSLLYWLERQRPDLMTRILLITGHASSTLQEAARRRGLFWIEKPFTLVELWEGVRKFCVVAEEISSSAA